MLRPRSFTIALSLALAAGHGLTLSGTAQAQAAVMSPVSNHEGVLAPGHDHALDKVRHEYFLTEDRLDLWKLERAHDFLLEQRRLLESSAKLNKKTNLIFDHGYSQEEGEKEGRDATGKEAEAFAPILFAIEAVEDLRKNYAQYDEAKIRSKVETTLLWFAAGYTIYPKGLFTSLVERAKVLAENFFEFETDDSKALQASNLMAEGRFASQEDLERLRAQGIDLSTLDPPSSAIWTNNAVEQYDVEAEVYFGRRMFPPRSEALPTFHYQRMGNGQVKFKTYWLDPSERTRTGKPKKKNVTLRVGWESYTASVVNHFARAIGYPANPTTFRHRVKLVLGDTSFEEFLSQYNHIHSNEMGSPVTHIERIRGENAVIIKNATLEAYPDDEDYRRIGPFRMGDNGLRNRREYRAMLLYNSLISLQDQFEYQSRVDAYRDPVSGEWRPLFFISDTSSALGLPAMLGNKGTVNEFTWTFTRKSDDLVRLFWLSVFDSRTWKDTTYSDVKWLARRLARLKTAQIDAILNTSGFPEPARVLYAEKFKSRINRIIQDFDLQREGFAFHPVRSPEELVAAYPEFIDSKGYLKEGAQEIPGNTQPILGNRFTPYQAVIVMGINTLQNQFLKLFDPRKLPGDGVASFVIGPMRSTTGVLFDASRDVSVNHENGPGQKRYLLKDKVAISIPVGLMHDRLTTPVALYYTYSFEYSHSVTKMTEVGTSRFFDLVNPFSIEQIRRRLALGEQLRVTHSMGASIGYAKVKAFDELQVEAALLGLSHTQVKTAFFSRTSEDILEVTANSSRSFVHRNGLDVRAIIRLGGMLSSQSSDSSYRLYRLDLLNSTDEGRESLEEAFEKALVYNDFALLDVVSPARFVDEESFRRSMSLSFFFWTVGASNSVSELNVNGTPVFLASESESIDRAFDRLWTEKIDPKAAKGALNLVGQAWNEGETLDVSFEGKASADLTRFETAELNISVAKVDNYCTRKEYEKEFKPFFNSRSGSRSYADFEMPRGLDQYLELEGVMRWQLSQRAVADVLAAATDWNNLGFIDFDPWADNRPIIDPREELSTKAARALQPVDASLSPEKRRKALREKARDILFVVKKMIGAKGERLPTLRKFTADDRIWVLTSFAGMLDVSHPSYRTTKSQLYYAPEIGKFQGHSFLSDFRRKNLMKPIFEN